MNRLLLLACTLLTWCVPASASKTIVVPRDSKSIQKAVEEADPGDTVFVLSGTYHENVTLKEMVRLIGQDRDKTIIMGTGSKPVVKGADNALIKNLTIEKGGTGILCERSAPTIEEVIVRFNHRTGIHCLISLPQLSNCIIYGNEWTGIFLESVFATKTNIDHCLIADNGNSGIMIEGRSQVLVQNSIFFNNNEYGVYVGEESVRSRVEYNNFYRNRAASNDYFQLSKTNISKDPGFPSTGLSSYDYSGSTPAMKGLGKEGAPIGVISERELRDLTSDRDHDGIPNHIDQCPDEAEDKDNFEDEDGCPDFDNDKDGIYDANDKCPNEPEDLDGFQEQDGCPDYDNDRDGIPDTLDKCPNQPETKNGSMDDDGCPDELPGAQSATKADTLKKKVPAAPADNMKKSAPVRFSVPLDSLKKTAAPAAPVDTVHKKSISTPPADTAKKPSEKVTRRKHG